MLINGIKATHSYTLDNQLYLVFECTAEVIIDG